MAFLFVEALKLLFFSAGLVSTLLMVKGALMPFLHQTFYPNIFSLWNSFRCLSSSPLYICLIINSVVLLIAATSSYTFHRLDDDPPPSAAEEPPPPETKPSTSLSDVVDECTDGTLFSQDDCAPATGTESEVAAEKTEDDDDERESETMESTWKAIVGEKLRKSDSVQVRPRRAAAWKELRKLETFNEGTAAARRVAGLRRDPSVGIDEFNQQVEAFINKFNQDMRLQRQESDQRFLDMIKRGL